MHAKGEWKLGDEKGSGEIAAEPDAISCGDSLRIEWLDVDALVFGNHRLSARIAGGDLLEISMTGAAFENLAAAARDAFDDAVAKGLMLDDGAEIAKPFAAQLDAGPEIRVRTYEHGIAVLGLDTPFAQPFGTVDAIVREEWAIQVGPTRITHAGKRFDELQRTLEGAFTKSKNDLAAKVTGYLADLGPMPARKVAALLRDGRAVAKSALEAAAAGSFAKLAERGPLPERAPKLAELLSRATGEPWCGLKLPSDARSADAGPLLFFVVPIADGELAFEVASEADHATYRFAGCTPLELAGAFVATRFRREPIYQKQDEVARGEWRMALRRGEPLPALRKWFKGREVHTVSA